MPSYDLLAAYCRTDYRVELPNRNFSIRPGGQCVELDEFVALPAGSSWAIITAENPRSRQLPDLENVRRRGLLRQRIDEAGNWRSFPTVAVCPQSEWPPEHGVLVAGIAEDAAISLAQDFDQHGILWGSAGTSATLRLTDPATWRAALERGRRSDNELLRKICEEVLAAQFKN